jgi:hypothetical protein
MLDLAFNFGLNYIKIATRDNYGEGIMIEPTREIYNSFFYYFAEEVGGQTHSGKFGISHQIVPSDKVFFE